MVGQGLHRMEQRRSRRPRVLGSRAAAAAGGSRFLRPARSRRPVRAGGAGPRVRNLGVLLLLLLVRREEAARSAAQRALTARRTRLSVLHLLAERELDAALGRA